MEIQETLDRLEPRVRQGLAVNRGLKELPEIEALQGLLDRLE